MSNCLQIICELLACVILLSFHVTGNTNGSEPLCVATIKVPRNTQFRALVMTELQINCTVIINKCDGNTKISWCKIDGNDCKALNKSNYTKTMWKNTKNYGIAFLTFLNISMDDAGLYRCKTQNSVSHAINVMVSDDETSHTQNNTINNKDDGSANIQNNANYDMRQYVGICSWIAGLTVILTGVSFIIIRSKSRNDKEENEAMITIYLDPSPLVPKTDDAHSNISSSSIYANIEHL